MPRPFSGLVAQLGERLDGIEEVSGSIPLGSMFHGCREQLSKSGS